MNKKLLSTLLYVTAATSPMLAMHYPSPSFDQNAVVAHMPEIQPITIPLQKSSLDYINQTSKWSALAGACAGLGAGYLILQNESQQLLHQPTEILRKIAIPTVSTILASGVGYYAGKSYATYNTQEKDVERKANNVISVHNCMIAASRDVKLDEHQRNEINSLPFEHFDNRLDVYKGLSVSRSENPINARFQYVRNTASKLRAENNAANKLGNLPDISLFMDSPFLQDHRDKANLMNDNRARIKYLNSMLSHQRLTDWASKIKKDAPEYKTDTLRKNLAETHCQLKEQEKSIRYGLARLALLIQCPFSHIQLSKNILEYVCSSWSTSYPDTPQGRKDKDTDIAQTSINISRAIQNYQQLNGNYNLQVIDHNQSAAEISPAMQNFVISQGGTTGGLNGREINKELLQYNHYLNHSKGSVLTEWINRCFVDNQYSNQNL